MANTKSITTATRAEVKRLRCELSIISDNKAQIVRTYNNMVDAHGYDAARDAHCEATLGFLAADRQRVLDKIDALLGTTPARLAMW